MPSIGFYNLVQGSTGIGVALASSIPQFNLKFLSSVILINGSTPVKSKNLTIPQSGFSSIASVNCLQILR